MQPSHSPPPGTCQHNTEKEIPVCGIDTSPKVWEGGKSKQVSKQSKNSSKTHGNAPADLPGPLPPPSLDPGELAAWA